MQPKEGSPGGNAMAHSPIEYHRVSKRLRAATGYLELGMTQHALDSLDGLAETGPFHAAAEFLRGEALRLQRRFDAAAVHFAAAARAFPEPHDRSAWLALSQCLRGVGDDDSALDMLARARGAKPQSLPPAF